MEKYELDKNTCNTVLLAIVAAVVFAILMKKYGSCGVEGFGKKKNNKKINKVVSCDVQLEHSNK